MSMKPTLLVLAAGMGSRYGGLKQLDGIGPNEEPIIEYSLYDSIKAGFGKVVFVIRKDFEEAFRKRFDAFSSRIKIEYAYQPVNVEVPGVEIVEREKPWGTSHAVLVAREAIQEPFAVINADDYYGAEAFQQMADFLSGECNEATYSMMGYTLKDTLSEHGTVNRGLCQVNANHELVEVVERLKIASKEGKVFFNVGADEPEVEVDPGAYVSMNFWGFHPGIFTNIDKGLTDFIKANRTHPKAEYYIPSIVMEMIANKEAAVKVIPTSCRWFGVTYKADKEMAVNAMKQYIAEGTYPTDLWG